MEGGAHGSITTQMLNIDAKSGQELTMADLLDNAGQAKVLKICLDQILAEKAKRFVAGAGDNGQAEPVTPLTADETKAVRDSVKPILAKLSSWRFGAESATVIFDQDAIGSHAEGDYQCELRYSQLAALAKASFPLPAHGG
jgi:hypothetical protein